MSAAERYLSHRGEIRAVVGVGSTLAFVTVHPEGLPTAVYRLDVEKADKAELAADPLPCGGVALALDPAEPGVFWVAGTDGRLYRDAVGKGGAGKPEPFGPAFTAVGTPGAPVALVTVSDNRLAVAAGGQVAVLSRKDGRTLQTLALPEGQSASAMAVDPTGRWLAVGTAQGSVAVFESEDRPDFAPSEADKLHDGAVTALLFEPDDLRFLSAGADGKLLSTHARGKLEPEDRGRGNNHAERVTGLLNVAGGRFLTASRDATIKTWPRTGGVKPATLKDGLAKIASLSSVTVRGAVQLVAGCEDGTLRLFAVDAEGRFGDATFRLYDAYAAAKREAEADDHRRREAALKTLAGFADARAVELLAERIFKEPDSGLRLAAVRLLGDCPHPTTAGLLEKGLSHTDEAVRLAAFEGLRKRLGPADLRPMELALKAERADVGKAAVAALEPLSASDDQALTRLTGALNAKTAEIRAAALAALERVGPADSPEADLVALGTEFADIRRAALVRLLERGLLLRPEARAAVLRRTEDKDAEVRRTAFLLMLCARRPLLDALQERDPDLRRQLGDLLTASATAAAPGGKPSDKPAAKEGKDAESERLGLLGRVLSELYRLAGFGSGGKAGKADGKAQAADLAAEDFEPLLQATASRSLDTCLRGTRALALLGDPRAFGLLLQLSREDDAATRAEVCRALAALEDPRSVGRLRSMLLDKDAAVRDAAFTALARLHAAEPLRAAEAGLAAQAEDVRRRGLQLLVADARRDPAAASRDEAVRHLMEVALNDPAAGVRSEAFKAALNLRFGGGGADTLAFARRSIHADIRREALTETTAHIAEPWAPAAVLSFLDDSDPKLRAEAFEFAVKRTKDLEPLEAALGSRYPDTRRQAVDALVKRHTAAAQALLVRALSDEDRGVRTAALDSLVSADARPALTAALSSSREDVRLRAARALARHGLPAALPTLAAIAAEPEPTQAERVKDWAANVEGALEGLAELGDPAALTHVVPLLDSRHAGIRSAAVAALAAVSPPTSLPALRAALAHSDPAVRFRAAFGLAVAGDASVAALVFSDEAGKTLSPEDRLVAAVGLGPAGEERLAEFLDRTEEPLRRQALLLMMMLETRLSADAPVRCLAALAAKHPRMRLAAAAGLERFADPAAFAGQVAALFNDRGDSPAWKVSPETVSAASALIALGSPQVRARTVRLLGKLSAAEQSAWDEAWSAHAGRFAREIKELSGQAAPRAKNAAYDAATLRRIAFGAYVGLVRELGGADKSRPAADAVRVRQTALSRIAALAEGQPGFADAARPVLVQVLGDPAAAVRMQAFGALGGLGLEPTALGSEALEAGFTDLGVKGLETLSASAPSATGKGGPQVGGTAVLEQAMLTRRDDLALEAAKLLMAQRGEGGKPTPASTAAVASAALAAAHEPLRERAVAMLAAEYDREPSARTHLRTALESKYQKVRESAALELAGKKDPAAFDALVRLAAAADVPSKRRKVIQAFAALGDPRAADVLLDRLAAEPAGAPGGEDWLKAAATFRRAETGPRLLSVFETDAKRRSAAFDAALAVSGHDQRIEDAEDERTDRTWEKRQHPRRDDLLARLAEACLRLGETASTTKLVPSLRWARGKEADAPLAAMAVHPDERMRRAAVEAVAWRLRKRGGPAEPLLRALSHRDPTTQFLAAEGLARAGRADGLTVLLSAADFMTDLDLRRRAVRALGEAGDVRALDTLLRIAGDDAHPTRAEAAEALGHLGRSPKADEILGLLRRLAAGGGPAADNALKGLRWFGGREAWDLIRKRAADRTFAYRQTATELLGHDDTPASRELLMNLLSRDGNLSVAAAAWKAAERLWGTESLEPDYAWLRNPLAERAEKGDSLKRLAERGDPARMFALFGEAPDRIRASVAESLLNRREPPLAEARAALGSNDERTVRLAARLLGRSGSGQPSAASDAKAVAAALTRWRGEWDVRRETAARTGQADPRLAERTTQCVEALVWAAGRLGGSADELAAVASAHRGSRPWRGVRMRAVEALAALQAKGLTKAALDTLEDLALTGDPEVRGPAAEAVAKADAKRGAALAGKMMADRPGFARLSAVSEIDLSPAAVAAAAKPAEQGLALPVLIRRRDVRTLSAIASDKSAQAPARLGAVEALAVLAGEPDAGGDAEAVLKKIGAGATGTSPDEEEFRKAVWRAVRRSQRTRKGGAKAPATTATAAGEAKR